MGSDARRPVILVVDDDESTRRALDTSLRQLGHVICVATPDEGFEILRSQNVTVVISDYKMPAMNGVEFLRRVKILYPDQIVMMITGFADLDLVVKAVNDVGIAKFIVKPWNIKALNSMIAKTIAVERMRRSLAKQKKGKNDALQEPEPDPVLEELERMYPGISEMDEDDDGHILSSY